MAADDGIAIEVLLCVAPTPAARTLHKFAKDKLPSYRANRAVCGPRLNFGVVAIKGKCPSSARVGGI